MTVADVPAGALVAQVLIVLSGEGRIVEVPIAELLATLLLGVDEGGVVCQDQGQVGLSGFVHVASMGHFREEVNGPGPVPQLSLVSGVRQVLVVDNFYLIPLLFSESATVCFHVIINHAPISVPVINELLETFENSVKHVRHSFSYR